MVPPDGNLRNFSKKTSTRAANLDLFRILAMLTIILYHTLIHGGINELCATASIPKQLYLKFIFLLSQIGVNCFVLISGYFLCKSKFSLQKLAALWLEGVFYSITIKAICMLSGQIPFSFISLCSCFLPVFTGRYWFVTIYFGLYLISPFLNILTNSLNKLRHSALCVIIFVLFSCVISIHPAFAGMNSGAGWGLPWFIALYIFAAWFRNYYIPDKHTLLRLSVWIVIPTVTSIAYITLPSFLPTTKPILDNFYRYDSVPVLLISLFVFSAFLNMRINEKTGSIISFIAPSTFGVYLIHDNPDLRPILWEVIDLPSHAEKWSFLFIQFLSVICIFIVCLAIDIIRKYTVGKIETSKPIVSICNFATNIWHRFIAEIGERI